MSAMCPACGRRYLTTEHLQMHMRASVCLPLYAPGVDRVRDVIGQPMPGLIAGRFLVCRNGDTFELWECVEDGVLERLARGLASAAEARELAQVEADTT